MDMAKKVLKANTPSQSATNLLAGVAVPTETASRLIADVWGEVEMSQESQRQVHYDYKNLLEEYDAEI